MELWIRVSDSVANGLLTLLVVGSAACALLVYARLKGIELFPRRKDVA